MSKIQKVTVEFDDKIISISGEEAQKWEHHNEAVACFSATHGCNPFDVDKINWIEIRK